MSASKSQFLKVHQAIARALYDNGIDTIFGLMGDANMFMVDSFVRDCGGKFVATSHEAGAATMALGYSLVSHKVGVCSVTHGPAMTNTVTQLVEGVKGSIPLVLVCGDTPVIDRENLQSVSQREFVIASGAGFEQLRSPKTVSEDVATALRRAIVERRPIVLNAPYEFDWIDVEYQAIRIQIPESRSVVSASDDLDNAIGMIASAKRPIVLAGRGAVTSEAKAAILRLAKRVGAPVATTLKGKDLFRGEDYNLGIFGTLSTPMSVEIIMESDCIIAFGASLNMLTSSHGAFLKGKRVIQVNLEVSEIGRYNQNSVGVVGDPAQVADIIVHWLNEAEIPESGFCTEELKQKIAADVPEIGPQVQYSDGTVDYKRSLSRLNELLPVDRIFVSDGGRFMRPAWTMIKVRGPDSFILPVNFGSIGLALSHAIGASFAAKGRPIVLVTGDGGFMHGGLVEFNTAVRYKLDIIVIVCNDGAYGAEHIKFRNRQMDPGMILFNWPDFAPVAIALGGSGVTVKSENDWDVVEEAIKTRARPLLIDIKLDPDRMPLN